MPATSIFMRALSSGISGMGNSRISVRLAPVLTAARTFSTARFLRRSVQPHVRLPHDRTVALVLRPEEVCEFRGRIARRLHAGGEEALPDLRVLHDFPRLRRDPLGDGARRL